MTRTESNTVPTTSRDIAVVFLHPACNMTCTFCGTENSIDSLTPQQARETIHLIKNRGMENVVLGGGEPFAWDHDVIELARVAKGTGLIVQIGTNGIDLPAGFDSMDCVDRYVLPLDGLDAESHNAVRITRDGHFDLILDRLETLRRGGKSVTVSTVVTSKNVQGLDRIARLLSGYHERGGQLHAWHLYKFLPIGRGGRENADALSVSDEDYDAACISVKQSMSAFPVYRRRDMRYSRHVDFFWYEQGAVRIGSEVWVPGKP
jgi:MoaA/NifB/PqqE/SkfB family radical SAM enzyme